MYRSKEKLLESVDETESVLSTYRSRLQGLTNRSFDYTTESSIHSTDNPLPDTPHIKVENVEVYNPARTLNEGPSIPVPLPRSKIPKATTGTSSKPPKHTKTQAKRRKEVDPEVALIERDDLSTESSIPLTTFVHAHEKVNKKSKGGGGTAHPLQKESSSTGLTNSTEDLTTTTTTTTTTDNKREESVTTFEKKIKKRRKKKTNLERDKSEDGKEDASVIGFYLHDLEYLRFTPDLESVHIRVSCYDQSNGHLLAKRQRRAAAASVDSPGEIVPLVSKRCHFESHVNYLHCIWEELLLVEEVSAEVLRNENSIIFFEIIAMLESSIDFKALAWAFLKPFGHQFDNFDKRSVLQVYQYNARMSIFENWRDTKRHRKYPSSLSITLKSITPLMQINKNGDAAAGEMGQDGCARGGRVRDMDPFDVSTLWTNKNFKCPNQVVSALKLPGKGTNLLKINPHGDLVAVTNSLADGHSQILICTVPELKVVQKLEGHSGFIYGFDWKSSTKGEKYPQTLISCSADQTALVWTIRQDYNYTLQVLPHVTFVYCCVFWENSESDCELILTGGKDSIIRVWSPFKGSFKIHQELSKGTGYVTCLVVSRTSMVYSGDSEGRVVEWKWTKEKSFEVSRTVYEDQSIISHLEMHPRIGNLFIGNRRGVVLSMDLETKIIIQRFEKGHQELRTFFSFRISNCGTYLIALGDGKTINCWNILTRVEVDPFDVLPRTMGTFSSIDLPKKGSFVILGRYQTNKNAVILINNSAMKFLNVLDTDTKSDFARPKETSEQTRAVKNKLTEIIDKLDQVFMLPRLCDDEKISLTQDMVNEKRRIEEWLDRNVDVEPAQVEASDDEASDHDDGTFVVERQQSVRSNGTFIVEKEEDDVEEEEVEQKKKKVPKKPKRKIMMVKQSKQESEEREEEMEKDEEKSFASGGTYEIKKEKGRRDTDADDTSVSDSVFA